MADKVNKRISYRRSETGRRKAPGEERGMVWYAVESVLMQLLCFFHSPTSGMTRAANINIHFLSVIKLSLDKTKCQVKPLLLSRWGSSSVV